MANGPIQLFPGMIPAAGRPAPGPLAPQQGGPGFNEAITGLLGNPALGAGIGLLAGALDRQPTGQTLLQGLGLGQQTALLGQRAESRAVRNDLLRQRLRQEAAQAQAAQQQQAAIQGLQGLLSGEEPVEQGQLLPLLAQVAPGAVAQGLLGQIFPPEERAETSLVRNVRALEDPTLSPEQQEVIRKNLTADPQATDQLLKTVELQLRAVQLENAQREAASEAQDAATQRTKTKSALVSDLNNAVRLTELAGRLQGTQLEPGTVGIETRRAIASGLTEARNLLGVDTATAQRMISDFDEFQKLSRNFATQSTSRQFGDQATNFQLQQLQQTVPNVDITVEANRRIARGAVQTLLNAADAEGIEIPNRQRFEGFLAEPEAPQVEQRGPITVIPQVRTQRRQAPAAPETGGGNRFRFNPATGELEPIS